MEPAREQRVHRSVLELLDCGGGDRVGRDREPNMVEEVGDSSLGWHWRHWHRDAVGLGLVERVALDLAILELGVINLGEIVTKEALVHLRLRIDRDDGLIVEGWNTESRNAADGQFEAHQQCSSWDQLPTKDSVERDRTRR